ncbi:MAG: hypothetical protein LC105_06430 [Chitinophagales bacterium]|nr:hypothetical protein [Chitinophagales bacterium]MCZ2393472.1 hypothetical protein [Chitinophagales bacterium]
MKSFKIDSQLIVILSIVLFAIIARVFTSGMIPNFTPIGALALFSGAYIKDSKWAMIFPITALLIGDLFLGFHNTMIFVYLSFALIILMSRFINYRNHSVARILGSTLLGTILFFLVTNFGVWALTGMYEMSFSGLMSCYVMGLPFLRNSLMGDLFYVTVFFGAFETIKHYMLSYKVV